MQHDIRISSVEEEAKRVIPEVLSRALGRGVKSRIVANEGFVEIEIDELPALLMIAPVRESRRPLVLRAAEKAYERAQAVEGRGLPAVVAPHMTRAGMEVAASVGVGWFDLAGNAHLDVPGRIHLHVEGLKPRARWPGRPPSAFAPRSARVARALLVQPDRHWSQKNLIEATGLAQGMVSRTLSRLRDLGLVVQDEDNRYRVPAPGELIDAWRDEYDYKRHEIVPAHLTGAGIGLARELAKRLRSAGVDHALTGLPAAWLYDGFAQFRMVSVFVVGDLGRAAELVRARVGDRGANVQLIRPFDEGVFYESQDVEGATCVHPVQVYLDLSGLPERASEAAEHLRQERIHY